MSLLFHNYDFHSVTKALSTTAVNTMCQPSVNYSCEYNVLTISELHLEIKEC